MVFCLYKSSCEGRPRTGESIYQCCNSCNNKTCTNRCKDDCNTCGLLADKSWVQKFTVEQTKVSLPVKPRKPRTEEIEREEALAKAQEELRSAELAKREARKKRREARKARNSK